MERTCEACGGRFDGKTVRARFCRRPECLRRRAKGWKRKERVGSTAEMPEHPTERLPLAHVVAAELERAGRLSSSLGVAAVALAERVDSREDTGSAVASLVKELRATLTEALKDADSAADPVDELRAARERRLKRA